MQNKMDTDNLSKEIYNAVIIVAEKFNHDLTLQFGLLADHCNDDNDYLIKAKNLITEWKTIGNLLQMNIFCDEFKPTKTSLERVLLEIENQIHEVFSTPIEKHKFEF